MERPQMHPGYSATPVRPRFISASFISSSRSRSVGRLLDLPLFSCHHPEERMLVPSFPALVNGGLHVSRNDTVLRKLDEERETSAGLFSDKASSRPPSSNHARPFCWRLSRLGGTGSQPQDVDIFRGQLRLPPVSNHPSSHPSSPCSRTCSICNMQSPVHSKIFHSRTNSREPSAPSKALCRLGRSSYQQCHPTRHSFLSISEPDLLPHDNLQYEYSQPPRTLRSCISILADRARAVLVRVRMSLRVAPPPRRRLSPHSPLPRLSIYQTRSSADSSLSGLRELLASPADSDVLALSMPGAWLEPKDASPHLDFQSTSPRPLSWPSIMPLSPDMPCDALSASTLDFRTAADLVLDHNNVNLPFLLRDDGEEDSEDGFSLCTPMHSQPRAAFALQSTWSDSESESDCDDVEAAEDAGFPSITFPPLAPTTRGARERQRVSIASLSLFPSPPGSPAFTECFSTLTQVDMPGAPKRSRRCAIPDHCNCHPMQPFAEPESPTMRTARIRRETLARLESSVSQR